MMILTCVILLVKRASRQYMNYERNKVSHRFDIYKCTPKHIAYAKRGCTPMCAAIQTDTVTAGVSVQCRQRSQENCVTNVARTTCTCDGNLLHTRRYLSSASYFFFFSCISAMRTLAHTCEKSVAIFWGIHSLPPRSHESRKRDWQLFDFLKDHF